jgi:hypothetical protein
LTLPPFDDWKAYLQAEGARLGIPDNKRCLVRIDAFPTDQQPKVLIAIPGISLGGFNIHTEPLDEFSDPTGKWRGYRYIAIGTLAVERPPGVRDIDFKLGLFFNISTTSVQVWQARAFAPGTDLYAQVDWRPGDERPEPLIGGWPKRRPPSKEITQAWRALSLIWEVGARGGGPKEITRRKARQSLIDLAGLADSNDELIEPYALSKYSTRGPRTIYNWLDRAEWSIEDLRIQLRRHQQRQAKRI